LFHALPLAAGSVLSRSLCEEGMPSWPFVCCLGGKSIPNLLKHQAARQAKWKKEH
jgi:hypothetical protein